MPSELDPPPARPAAPKGPGWYWLLLAACALSIWQLKLAPFLLVGAFIARLALPRTAPRFSKGLALASLGLALLAFVRFLIVEAVPGIVQGGTRATQDAAVSKLREILAAQDALRRHGLWDPDGDGIGSAAHLQELTGEKPVRGQKPLSPPLLQRYPTAIETQLGPAIELGGYLYVVCLPTADGRFSAKTSDRVDEELAERRYVAYAWPAKAGQGLRQTFFLDQHEQIKKTSNPAYVGPDSPPPCDAALRSENPADAWQDWKGKRARRALPGDKQSSDP